MKPTLVLAACCWFTASLSTVANPLTRRLVSEALEVSGRSTLEAGAQEAAERAAATAIQRLGGQGTETLIQRGGYELLEAAARHGDDVLTHAARVPAAARYIAARPQEALSLVGRYGDDALLLEARAPGMTEQAAALLGREALPQLAKAAPADVTQLVGYAARADTQATRRALLHAWEQRGNHLLQALDQRKALILTGGLTTSMVLVADGVQDAIQDIPGKVPEATTAFSREIGAGISASLILATGGGIAVIACWCWVRRPSRRRI